MRFKKNIEKISSRVNILEALNDINGVYYNWNNMDDDTSGNAPVLDSDDMPTDLRDNYHDDRAIALRFDLIENVTFKTEYHYIIGNQKTPEYLSPDGRDRYTNLVAAKITYNF